MFVQFDVYISKKCNDITVRTEIYMCMHLYPYVYLAWYQKVAGSSATRGELFSRKVWLFQDLQQLKVGAVSHAW